jgi:hypothetical protein
MKAELTEKQFDALASISRLQIGSKKMLAARAVLCWSMTPHEAAAFYKMPYRDVWRAVKNARDNIQLCKIAAGVEKP